MKNSKTTRLKAEHTSDDKLHVSLPYRLLLVLITLILIVLAGGYFLYHTQKQAMRQRVENELSAIARLKVDQISNWRQDRLADADILVSILIGDGIAEWITAPNPVMTERIRTRLETMEKHYPYQDISLVASGGTVLMNIGNTRKRNEVASSQLARAFQEQKPLIIDFYDLQGSERPHLDVIAPLFMPQNDTGQARAAIVLSVDPEQYLYPLIQTWPTPSRTAETLLVRREGNSVLFLNELRHQKNTALKLKIPLSNQEVPAVAAVSEKEGIFEGKDYRGVEVLSVLKVIPYSPWFMIAKIDTDEAFSDVQRSAVLTQGLIFGIILLISVSGGLLWQRRQKMTYQTLYDIELARKGIEEALRERETELSAIWLSVPLLILIVDQEYRIIKANSATEKFAGRCHSEMVGMRGGEALGCLHSLDDPRGCGFGPSCPNCKVRLSVIDTFETGNSHHDVEWRLPFICDGKPLEMSFILSTVLLSAPKKQVMVCIQDITERQNAEEALARSETKYRGLFESIKDGIVYTDISGKFLGCNQAYSDMLGYSEEELRELTYHQLTPISWAAIEEEIVRNQIIPRGYSDPYEKEYMRKNGAIFPINIRAWLIRNEKGEAVGMWGIVRDITEQKRAQEAIKALNEALKQRAAELEASNRELEAFSYSVSHDLRAPLRSMTGFSEALIEDYSNRIDVQGKQYLRWIQESGELMSQLIDDLLQLSRVTRADMNRVQVDISALAWSIMEDLKKTESGRQIEFKIARGMTCQGDSRLLRRMLENLIGNAWKFTGKVTSPTIEMGVTNHNGERAYFIRDNGVGFDMTYSDKLFKPFQRLHKTDEFSGTGIGLATVQRIIHRHGGRVWAESEVGKGATFYFTLS